ncbi:efflux RND transporter periplasmic adaptor subunit [Serratia sp. M24T3]|uniref:efflux RND transporter periplasmic adaptor subunit n=1 Tax=Serratia sp. M24T3 TaxID=932213 RepID=UPI00025B9F0B|nr:efflux RND transporter periplasmic adaptor subunit [Serratia sp. M24T3]EIC86008.1 RND family efflux transporter MFP subunit [Serratia sp. M24T3]
MSKTYGKSRRRGYLALAAVVVAIAAALYLSQTRTASAKVTKNSPIPIGIQSVQVQNLPISISEIGNVQALNTVNVKVRADGELQQVYFKEGQWVHAGDLLAQVDPKVYQAQVLLSKATMEKDQAQLASTMVDYTRARKLAAAGAGPTQNVDTLKAQVAALKAAIDGDKANLDIAQLQLGYTRITAPISGHAGQRQIDAGSIVHGSDANGLVTLTQMNPISVAFSVPQGELPAILKANANAPLTVIALTRDATQQIAHGRLSFIDSQVATDSGQIQLKANFTNDNNALWPGQLISVKLIEGEIPHALVVPVSAVQQGQQGNYVYAVKADNTVAVQWVKTGETVDNRQQIVEGLQPGQRVATSGQFRLASGDKVSALPPVTGARP